MPIIQANQQNAVNKVAIRPGKSVDDGTRMSLFGMFATEAKTSDTHVLTLRSFNVCVPALHEELHENLL